MYSDQILRKALSAGRAIPAFNVPYLPMIEPVIEAIKDENTVAFVEVARLEWEKFESEGIEPVHREFTRIAGTSQVRLHLDHIPVIDEDDQQVPFLNLIKRAIDIGYDSVMVDGSRLSLDENIEATAKVVEIAHPHNVPVEAELGAVMGHEESPIMSYEEILAKRAGFTDPDEAERFVRQSGCDWLSVAFGNIHGFVSKALRDQDKISARLDIEHLHAIHERIGIPIVLHGGSGVTTERLQNAVNNGIAKVNVGTDIRKAYEHALSQSDVSAAQNAVYDLTKTLLSSHFRISGMKSALLPESEH